MTNWTPEQLTIFSRVSETSDNLLIEALAGSGKTTTLVGIADRLGPGTLALAFNKKAADELSSRIPTTAEARTLNSLGHRILSQKLSKRLRVSSGKLRHLLTEALDGLPRTEQELLRESWGDIADTLRWAKAHGHVPDRFATNLAVPPLLSDEAVYASSPFEPPREAEPIILSVLEKSWAQALDGQIDFDDQLLLPTFLKCLYPTYHNVLVDEAQDLSALNHLMLTRLAKRRFVGVGDSLQAIYAFRGAHQSSMAQLREAFAADTLHLSTSFRCPEAVCLHVKHHARRITPWPDNPNNPGTVTFPTSWSLSEIPDGSAILCRNNAPLFRIAISLFRAGRRPNLWGRDIASGLVKLLERLGGPSMERKHGLASLEAYATRELAKLKKRSAQQALEDRVACVRVFLEATSNLGEALATANAVLESKGMIDLATGHKAKGYEWPDVFVLDPWLIGDEGQELNLAYVLATRAMRSLTYVDSRGLVES